MRARLLICTDLDRTLIPNGKQPESKAARAHFALLAARPEVTLAYVSGRDRALVKAAIADYRLPLPQFVIGDVGTSIYQLGDRLEWRRWREWEDEIGGDWNGVGRAELQRELAHLTELQPQEPVKQGRFKLSFYVPPHCDRDSLAQRIERCAAASGVRLRQVWSVDEMAGVGLLDLLPRSASKRHAIETLMQRRGFSHADTVFCGDSGNDIEVLASPVPAVLVANAADEVRALALKLAREAGHADRLYLARGNFMGLNGNYSAGMLEGIAHYHPATIEWMGFSSAGAQDAFAR